MKMGFSSYRVVVAVAALFFVIGVSGQGFTVPPEKEYVSSTGLWLGTYTKYRIKEKLFYYGEYHLRTRDWANEMAQIYLRFGVSYLATKYFEITAGFVNPYYWAPSSRLDDPNIQRVVPQWRGWQQFIFYTPFDRLKLYHQIRTEQRWRKDFYQNAPFELTHRFRYKLTAYYPLNNDHLDIDTYFLSFYEEIFIQTGKTVIYDHMEDNRLFLGLGYIVNENLQIQAGYMHTYRHNGSPFRYENRHILRLSFYHNLDFYRQ